MSADAPTSEGARPKVLHVVHRLGSGVEMVLLDYVRATPEVDHHVVYSTDPSCHDPRFAQLVAWASTEEVASDPRAFAGGLRRARRRVGPDLVHAHSSIGGAVARGVCFGVPLVYTPHCFAFLRQDVSRPARAAFKAVEAGLSRHTTAYAACSPHEAQLAERFRSGRPVFYVPNIASVGPSDSPGDRTAPSRDPGAPFTIVASGRISPQKDPDTFAALARELAGRSGDGSADVRCVWIGSGSPEDARALEDSGVEVTGWLDRPRAMDVLGGADLYVHTALWEATPLTILEAAALDVPVLARHTDPIAALGLDGTWRTTADLVTAVRALLGTGDLRALRESNARLRARHHPDRLQAELRACYARAGGDRFTTPSRTTPRTTEGTTP